MRKNKLLALVLSLAMAFALIAPVSAYDASRPEAAQTLSGGAAESYYIDPSGTLWAWGDNSSGQLGDGTDEARSTPWQVMDHVTAVSAGYGHSLALKEDGTLWSWSRNPEDTMGTNKAHPQLSLCWSWTT